MLNRAKYIRWPQAWCRISLPNSHFKIVLRTSPRPWPDLNLNPVPACVINSLSEHGTSNKLAPAYWPVSASLLILDNAKVAEALSFYRSCDRVDHCLSSSKQKLAIVRRARPGNCGQTHDLCAQCDTRRTAVSLAKTAENRTLCDVSEGRFSRTERIKPHHPFSYVKNCYNVLRALTPAFKISVTTRFRRNISPSWTDKNEEPSSDGFSRHQAAACLCDWGGGIIDKDKKLEKNRFNLLKPF